MLVLTIIVGTLNLCLGFALAAYLGYGPPDLLDGLPRLSLPHFLNFPFRRGVGSIAPPSIDMNFAPPSADELGAMFDMGDEDEMAGATSIAAIDEPYDDDVAQLLSPQAPEHWDLNEKFVETSILRLNIAMMKSGMRATEIDTKLRASKGKTDRELIDSCYRLLREDCIVYLAEQKEAADKFHARIDELGELASLGEDIEIANLEQAAQVETTINNLDFMDFHTDLEAGNVRLLEEIKNLRMARHKMRDNQEIAFLTIARYESRIDKIEKQLYNDPLTKLRNRVGLECTLNEWWKQGRHQSRQISAAMIDMDGFGLINEKYGPLLGDRILYQIAQYLFSAIGKQDMATRYSGQQFVIAFLDNGPRTALKNLELIRQTLEKMTFVHETEKIQLTGKCSFTEVRQDDAYTTVFDRLEKTMKKTRAAGANRTFEHDLKDEIKLIESPNLGPKDLEMLI